MTKLILKYFSIIATIYLLSLIFSSVSISSTPALLILGLVLFLVNLLIKPILLLLTLPLSVLTFGLFSFIVNAWTIMLADSLVSGVKMGGFWYSLLAAFIISIFQHLLKDATKSSH